MLTSLLHRIMYGQPRYVYPVQQQQSTTPPPEYMLACNVDQQQQHFIPTNPGALPPPQSLSPSSLQYMYNVNTPIPPQQTVAQQSLLQQTLIHHSELASVYMALHLSMLTEMTTQSQTQTKSLTPATVSSSVLSSTKNETEKSILVIEQDNQVKSKKDDDDDAAAADEVMYLKISKGQLSSNLHIRQYLGYRSVKKEPEDMPTEQTVIHLTDKPQGPPPQGPPPVQSPTATDHSVTQQVPTVPLPSQQAVIQLSQQQQQVLLQTGVQSGVQPMFVSEVPVGIQPLFPPEPEPNYLLYNGK